VLATDLETTFLERLPYANVTVRQHDIVADALPEGKFDLVHARWVLHWLPARRHALTQMVAALRPHGWLLVEEPDFVTPFHACASEAVCKVVTAGIRAMERLTGAQSEYGRRLFEDVCEQALVDVEAFGRVLMMRGGSPLCAHLSLSIAKVQAGLVGSREVTTEEIEEALARLNDPAFAMMSTITMAVWGRRAVVERP
jgi:SAM-dependent methyltransferase